MTDTETWYSPDGTACALQHVPFEGEWYPEGPGQRPPASYQLVAWDGRPHEKLTVFPVEPWSPYDAVHDKLVSLGWARDTSNDEPYRECEHGLSADLCSGPNHY